MLYPEHAAPRPNCKCPGAGKGGFGVLPAQPAAWRVSPQPAACNHWASQCTTSKLPVLFGESIPALSLLERHHEDKVIPGFICKCI